MREVSRENICVAINTVSLCSSKVLKYTLCSTSMSLCWFVHKLWESISCIRYIRLVKVGYWRLPTTYRYCEALVRGMPSSGVSFGDDGRGVEAGFASDMLFLAMRSLMYLHCIKWRPEACYLNPKKIVKIGGIFNGEPFCKIGKNLRNHILIVTIMSSTKTMTYVIQTRELQTKREMNLQVRGRSHCLEDVV